MRGSLEAYLLEARCLVVLRLSRYQIRKILYSQVSEFYQHAICSLVIERAYLSQFVQFIDIIDPLTNLLNTRRRVATMMTSTRWVRCQHLRFER